ncbi:MAG: hypothetical protein M0R51_04000 [Clostridia bacterium]|nr:hypothetical protein [Clostridia bacterium]
MKEKCQKIEQMVSFLEKDEIKTIFLVGGEPLLNCNPLNIIKRLKIKIKWGNQ